MNELGESKSTVELQKKFDEKRANVTKTVSEIRTTVTKEVEQRKEALADVKDSVKEAMNLKKQFRKRPLEVTAGAVLLGAIVGSKLFARNIGSLEYEYYRQKLRNDALERELARSYSSGYAQPHSSDPAVARRQEKARKSPGAALLALAVAQTAKIAGRMIVPAVMAAITGKIAAEEVADSKEEEKIVVVPSGAAVGEKAYTQPPPEKDNVIRDVHGNEL